jgi:uncharacterized protein
MTTPLIVSKFNILSKIEESDKYYIVNLLHGNADILEENEAQQLMNFEKGKGVLNNMLMKSFSDKGYIIEASKEQAIYQEKYLQFLDHRANDEIQIFYVFNYSCNFGCSYCYQSEYSNKEGSENWHEITNAFFQYISKEFSSHSKYLTLFGGEPLLNSPLQKEKIKYFLSLAQKHNLEVAIVTNGYYLEEYLPILANYSIREIQVTLDGTENMHNNRRYLKNGGKTFDKIVSGIEAALKHKLNINLRVVTDRENINNLPDLARFCIDKGWTKSTNFKTQIGRNYELHYCQQNQGYLFTRLELYKALYKLIQKYPEIEEFHKPAFSISKFLWENGELPQPLFDACPACKTEWAFDYTGNIYSCTATVGKSDESLGTFYPEVNLDTNKVLKWEERDVVSIMHCKDCNLQLACGGGCGAVAKNKSNSIISPDCRPVQEEIELGIAHYFKSELLEDKMFENSAH